MKYSSLQAFEKHLESAAPNHLSNIYMIISKESFDCKRASEQLIAKILKGQAQPELCLKIFDSDNLNLKELLNELNTLTLFSPKQVILLQNADKLTQQERTALEPYVASPSSSLFFIITASSINHGTNFFKKAEKAGIILEIPEQKPWEKERTLVDWVMREVASAGKRIDLQTAQCLVKQIGTDQTLLTNELEKLFCYLDDRVEITVRDLSAICVSVNAETIWQLGEAIFQRNGGTALRIIKALLNEGAAFLALLNQIRGQFQTEFQVCSILTTGGNGNDITQRFPYMRGNILDRHMHMAQNYGLPRFKKGMQQIDTVIVMAKNSNVDDDVLAEILVAKLVTQ